MTPQSFIENRLNEVKLLPNISQPNDSILLVDEVLRLLLSKKFRKYSASADLIDHCRNAISTQIANKQPINITFLQGAYKLWRLDESPDVDWAELFSLMYYTNWVKGICKIYKPGVWFDLFVDDLIIPKLDNVPISDIENYIKSYNNLMIFLQPYQPNNLKMTITPVGSQFESAETFYETLEQNLQELKKKSGGELPELTDVQRAMIELNVKTTPEQEADPKWRERVWQLHSAYSVTKRSANYHYRPDKILAFTQPLPSGTTLSVGSTKSSVVKFWVGVGALKHKDNSYQEAVLSPSQIQSADFEWEKIDIKGLSGKNFDKIRVIQGKENLKSKNQKQG